MEYIDKQYKAPKEVDEVMAAVVNLIGSVKRAQADGWQWGQDLPTVLMENFSHLSKAVEGMDKLDDEWAADPAAVIKAVLNPSADIVFELMKKEEPAPAPAPAE